jgi:cell wall-associated NlpC family hydrolase
MQSLFYGLALLAGVLSMLVFAIPLTIIATFVPHPATAGSGSFAPPPSDGRLSPPLHDAPVQSDAVDVARRYLGIPYVFGGTNPEVGLDC